MARWLMATLQVARADDENTSAPPQRPAIMFNRWQEDWSVLADPRVPRQAFDSLKYIPLSATDPKTYLSFGADTRERFEANNAAGFGTGTNRNQDYVITRNEFHADLRVANELQVFLQFQSNWAPWKTMLTPVDVNQEVWAMWFFFSFSPLSSVHFTATASPSPRIIACAFEQVTFISEELT